MVLQSSNIESTKTNKICLPKEIHIFNICNSNGNRPRDGFIYEVSINSAVIKKGSEFGYAKSATLCVPTMLILLLNQSAMLCYPISRISI